MTIEQAWPAVRTLLPQQFSFAGIKEVAGAATLPVHELDQLRQGSGGASKGQLMDGLDGLFRRLPQQRQQRVVVSAIAELVRKADEDLARRRVVSSGFGLPSLGVPGDPAGPAQGQTEIPESPLLVRLEEITEISS